MSEEDPLDYRTRTHHSNAEVFDRIEADDLKQAATTVAAFVYQTAMIDEKLPHRRSERLRQAGTRREGTARRAG